MQTFLPDPSFSRSAELLDYRRLGKQRVECKQILKALHGMSKGWVNHPATKMWRGYEYALALYGSAMCQEWIDRGYNDSLLPEFESVIAAMEESGVDPRDPRVYPGWLGDDNIHASHRSNLLRKDPTFYSRYGWSEPDDLEYVWPVP
jgi:hypothetical protein